MMRKELAQIVADLTGTPMTTVENNTIPKLQNAGLLPNLKGRGESDIDATYRVTVLLASLLPRRHTVTPAESVNHWRSLEPGIAVGSPSRGPRPSLKEATRNAFHFVEGLGFKPLPDLGAALDSIVESMRTDAFEKWTQGVPVTVSVDFYGDDLARVYFDRPQFEVGASFTFGTDDAIYNDAPIQRIIRINRAAFERLASA
jgi:hypothetical protein